MDEQTRLIPSGTKLIKNSVFFWLIYTASAIIFAIVATTISATDLPALWTFIIALAVSSAFLVGAYSVYSGLLSYYIEGTKRGHYRKGKSHLSKEELRSVKQMIALLEVQTEALYQLLEQKERLIEQEERLKHEIEKNQGKLQALLRQ
jgi:hypothetical protein